MCKTRRNVTLSKELDEYFQKEADSAGMSVPAMITFALLQYKKQNESLEIMHSISKLEK